MEDKILPLHADEFRSVFIEEFIEKYPNVLKAVNTLLLRHYKAHNKSITFTVSDIRSEIEKDDPEGKNRVSYEIEDVYRQYGWNVKYNDKVFVFSREQ